ncbi:MAG: hypothetical protein PCFJNLEI_03286 [Verrucomicrobiae bacterium]|nr:hypothetical protein [Verrucomicrobiae bacterium]
MINSATRRLVMIIGWACLALMAVLSFVALCVWIENRFPADENQPTMAPVAQRWVTKPVVNALSRQVSRYVRHRLETLYLSTGLTLEETIARFLDETVPLADRRVYAYRLARVGTPPALAALLKVFQTAPPEHQAFMAQLIGSTGNPAVKPWLLPLLNDPNPQLAQAALRGLCVIGGADVTELVTAILGDAQRPESVRVEAALGLGTLGTPPARAALVAALRETPSETMATTLLRSLGRFDFPAIEEVFTEFLAAPDIPAGLREVAVEALAQSSTAAVPFLMGTAAHDADETVRAAAAWAISAHGEVRHLGPELAQLAQREQDPDVRRRLYEAMLPQSALPADELLPVVLAEADVAARVAGFNALGRAVASQPASPLRAQFDQAIVPELQQIASSENTLNIRMRAVFALRRAGTPGAREALVVIAQNSTPQIAVAASRGL